MNKILFIDTMTTGANTERCALIEVGGIYVEGDSEVKRFDFRFRPNPYARIYDESLWIGGITRADLARFPEEGDAFKAFLSFLDSLVNLKDRNDKLYLCGFNAAARDSEFIKELFRRQESRQYRNYFHMQVIDLAGIAAFALMEERTGMPDFSLETASRFIGVTPTVRETYNCVDNAETCLKMYSRLRIRLHLNPGEVEFRHSNEIVKNW